VPGKRGADMVGASALACSGDFLLRLAGCQRKDLVADVRRTVFGASRNPVPGYSGDRPSENWSPGAEYAIEPVS
jgi:hypothetical protein